MYIYYLFNYLFIYFASFIYEFIYWHLLSISSIEFQGKRCDLNFLAHKHYSQTQGYRMRLLSSTFSPNGLGYKMPTSIFTSLQKGRILCHKMPISLVTNLQKEKKPLLQNPPVIFSKSKQDGTSFATKMLSNKHPLFLHLLHLIQKHLFKPLSPSPVGVHPPRF